MAFLEIRNFPDDLYREIRARAKQHGRSLSEEVVRILTHALAEDRSRSLLDLRGLGKSIWADTDAGQYVARERDAWGR